MCVFFFFNDTATTEIYTLSLHDALPIWRSSTWEPHPAWCTWTTSSPRRRWTRCTGSAWSRRCGSATATPTAGWALSRSEEHTSELQSRQYLVCRLLLEKKKNNHNQAHHC